MTNNTNALKEKELPHAGLLWITDTGAVPMAAPQALGGASWQRQMDEMQARAKQEGYTLGDDSLFATHVPETLPPEARIVKLREFVTQYPTRKLFVPGSVFADLTRHEHEVYTTALKTLRTELLFCSE